MKRLSSLCIALMVLLIFTAWRPGGQTRAQGETLVRISPEEVTLEPGESTTIAVEVVAVTDLRGFEVRINFDPALLFIDPDSLQDGGFLGPGLYSPVDDEIGTINFGKAIFGNEGSSESGALFTFTVQAKQRLGETPLEILRSDLVVGDDCSLIPHTVEHGLVKIISDQESGFQVYLPLVLR